MFSLHTPSDEKKQHIITTMEPIDWLPAKSPMTNYLQLGSHS